MLPVATAGKSKDCRGHGLKGIDKSVNLASRSVVSVGDYFITSFLWLGA